MVFETLKERWILIGKIIAETPLHIGRGRGERELLEPDLPVIKLPDGRVYIPGSSLKGAIRSELDRLVKGLGFRLCISSEPRYKCSPPNLCISCTLFGSTEVGSRIVFRDAISSSTDTFQRVGIAIDRESKKVVTGALYEGEYVPPGAEFNLEIVAENPEKWMIGLLWICMENLVGVGGQISRGAGKVRIELSKIEIYTPESIIEQRAERVIDDPKPLIEECKAEFKKSLDVLKEKFGRKEV